MTLLYIMIGYLSGSVLYARIFGRVFKKDGILPESRDHNPGAANAFRYGGFWCGLLTLCGDMLKGFLPVWLYVQEADSIPFFRQGLLLVLAAPVLGHIFPVFFGFQGGKGIAVTFGCLLGLAPDILPAAVLAFFFIFFSVILKVSPHFYRTIAAYTASCGAMFLLHIETAICVGFVLITSAVCLRLHLSTEAREKPEVKLLWMH